jgi:hypothetical protein
MHRITSKSFLEYQKKKEINELTKEWGWFLDIENQKEEKENGNQILKKQIIKQKKEPEEDEKISFNFFMFNILAFCLLLYWKDKFWALKG